MGMGRVAVSEEFDAIGNKHILALSNQMAHISWIGWSSKQMKSFLEHEAT